MSVRSNRYHVILQVSDDISWQSTLYEFQEDENIPIYYIYIVKSSPGAVQLGE